MAEHLEGELADLFNRAPELGVSLAAVVTVGGELVAERYGTQPATMFSPESAVRADTPLVSWSTAKSITHAAIGVAAMSGLIEVEGRAPVPGWEGTEKEAITILDLLEMRSGLHFIEDYVDSAGSNCLEMLFGSGADDMAAYAAQQPLEHPPASVWNYSSGSTNILCRVLGDAVGGGEKAMRRFLGTTLFGPTGMASADPVFDPAGTFIGSSYVYATARDFARFGELYRNDGISNGQRVLPEGWTDHARTQIATDPETGFGYGRHWWTWPDMPGSLAAHGYEGQFTIVMPDRELVVVHLGKTAADARPVLVEHLRRIIAAAS